MAVDFYDFGVEVDVEAPPADQVDDIAALFGSDTEVGGRQSNRTHSRRMDNPCKLA